MSPAYRYIKPNRNDVSDEVGNYQLNKKITEKWSSGHNLNNNQVICYLLWNQHKKKNKLNEMFYVYLSYLFADVDKKLV